MLISARVALRNWERPLCSQIDVLPAGKMEKKIKRPTYLLELHKPDATSLRDSHLS